MRSNAARALLGAALVVAAVALFVLLQDESGDEEGGTGGAASGTTTTGASRGDQPNEPKPRKPAIPTVVVRNGKPVGGVAELTYERGERVRFRVTSDVGDEVHVHGYDITRDVEAGGSVGFDFPATIEGLFEAELEHRGEQIAELRVNP